jgi:hypothetical protein
MSNKRKSVHCYCLQFEQQAEQAGTLNLKALNDILLRRDFLEKKYDEPYFDELVVGFFVRIGIGMNSERKPVYRVAQVVGIKESPKQYTLSHSNKTTNKLLVLKHANSEPKSFSMEHVSNHSVTQVSACLCFRWKSSLFVAYRWLA